MKKLLISLLMLVFIIMFFTLSVISAEESIYKGMDFFKNKNVFCIEVTQDFSKGNFTKTSLTYKDDETLKEFQSGLGYILSYYDISTSERETNSYGYYKTYEDPVQLALWYYFSEHEEEAKSFFGSNCKFGLTATSSDGVIYDKVVYNKNKEIIYRNGTIKYYSNEIEIR